MTAEEFRALALGLPETVESSHHRHPDFRVRGKIFATLGYPSREWGVVRLSSADQARVTQEQPEVFVPVKGAWGRSGNTQVNLRLAGKRSVRAALRAAWQTRVAAPSSGSVAITAPARSGRKPARSKDGR